MIVAAVLANRIQLTTDGNRLYVEAVERAFAGDVDYAMLVKHYSDEHKSPERKYSPSAFVSADKRRINGTPRCGARFDESRRTSEPDYAHVDATLHATHQCL